MPRGGREGQSDETSEAHPPRPTLADLVADAGKDLHRVIVVTSGKTGDRPYLDTVFANAGLDVPAALTDWEDRVDDWCDDYRCDFPDGALVEVNLETAVVVFDRWAERVVVAFGLSHVPAGGRGANRMRRFPDVNVGVRVNLREDAFVADRGHFLRHAAGGELDINLFPQRRELNRGWSTEGKAFRRMERYAAAHPGPSTSTGRSTTTGRGSRRPWSTACCATTARGGSRPSGTSSR